MESCAPADNMLGLRMFKGSENYSFEMDESCTCQVYQSCTLYISFPLAGMHNFPSMQISTRWERRARLARLPEHVPRRRKWIISPEQGTKQCNFVLRRVRGSHFVRGDKVGGGGGSLRHTNSSFGWNQRRRCSAARLVSATFIKIIPAPLQPRATSNLPGLGVPLAVSLHVCACVSVSPCTYYELSDEN